MRLRVQCALLRPSACSHSAASGEGFSHPQDSGEGKAKELHEDEPKDSVASSYPFLWQPIPILQQAAPRNACFLHRWALALCWPQPVDNDVHHRSWGILSGTLVPDHLRIEEFLDLEHNLILFDKTVIQQNSLQMSAASHSWNLINAAQPQNAVTTSLSTHFQCISSIFHSNSSYKEQKILSHISLRFFFPHFFLPILPWDWECALNKIQTPAFEKKTTEEISRTWKQGSYFMKASGSIKQVWWAD